MLPQTSTRGTSRHLVDPKEGVPGRRWTAQQEKIQWRKRVTRDAEDLTASYRTKSYQRKRREGHLRNRALDGRGASEGI